MRNLWSESLPAAKAFPRIEEGVACDALVVGGGYTGLSTALHLAEAGAKVALLEAEQVGAFAAGRNGGQVVPGLKPDPEAVVARFGREAGERLVRIARGAADAVFRLVERHRIACGAARSGWIQAAYSDASLASVERRARQLRDFGGNVELLDGRAMEAATGSRFYPGGLIDRDAGSLQPLAYARGLAGAASAAGARIFERSRVSKLERRGGKWIASVNGHEVAAAQAVLATDAYTDRLWPGLAQSFVTVTSAQIATDPLPEALRRAILPSRSGVSETRKITYYYRLDDEGRFVIGGRGPLSDALTASTRETIRKAAVQRYPALAGIEWRYGWSGRIGMTIDDLPHLNELAPGLLAAYGYCGRGVALATCLGEVLADRVLGRSREETAFPLTPLRRIPLHPIRQPLAAAIIAYHRLRDALGYPA